MAEPVFERLVPDGARLTAPELAAELRGQAAPAGDRPRVLVNMVATVDGHAAIGGRSGPIGGEADRALFHALREVPDALLVGAGTLRSERYGRLVRKPERRERRVALGLAADPLAVVVSRSLDLPWDAPVFHAPEQRIVLFAARGAPDPPPGLAAAVEVVRLDEPAPERVLRTLASAFGVRVVLCEGGPTLNRSLLAAGALDELLLAVGPLLAGGDPSPGIVAGPPLPSPVPLQLEWLLRHGREVFLRYAVQPDAQRRKS